MGHDSTTPVTVHGTYRPAVAAAGLVHTSGQIPVVDGQAFVVGRVGADVSVEEAQSAAAWCAVSAIRAACQAIQEHERLFPIKMTVFVAAAPGYTGLPAVANGASEVMAQVFDDVPARSAVGVAELPLGVPVELEAVFAIHAGE